MISLRDLPIKRKLMVVILLTSSFALLLMGSALIVYERVTFRSALAVNMNVLAQIVGSNSTAALAFDDPKNAREILGGLSAENQIKGAVIYDRNGRIFASFPDGVPLDQFPARPGPDGHKFDRSELVMFEPIFQQGTRLGTIYLQADLGAMYSRFRVYGLLLFLVGICSTLAAMALSARLQRRISSPILELAKTATAVSRDRDYSVRASKQGTDEIGQLTEAFNEMLARIGESNAALAASEEDLRAANKEKDNFFAILSHELRTPLTPALAAVANLEDDTTLPPNIHAELEMIRRNIEVEARLIDDLLDINRIARGKLDLHRQVVDVRPLLEHALQNYCAVAAAKKNIRVSTKIMATETHVFADSSRLTQVFWNLLQNACKFTPDGGAINVQVYNEYRRMVTNQPVSTPATENSLAELIVQVRDTGMGIRAETLPRIFNAFEQGARSRNPVFGGLGLGLSISRAIMEMHGGSIGAASEGKDKGATFTIRLHTVKPVITGRTERPPTISPQQIATRPMCVLVVEDHSDTAEQFARLLRRSGHEVICARTIREAHKYAMMTPAQDRACAFDILISDLDLPDGSGRDLMRNLGKRYRIRGIAISGHGMKEDVENSMAAGFSYHITKPVDWQELKTAIRKIAEDISEGQPVATNAVSVAETARAPHTDRA
jgi:signal transduction histidine kinase/DNA-binding NarL/FixJ family response regulator